MPRWIGASASADPYGSRWAVTSRVGVRSPATAEATSISGDRTASADSDTTPTTYGAWRLRAVTSEVFAPLDAPIRTSGAAVSAWTAAATALSSSGGAAYP